MTWRNSTTGETSCSMRKHHEQSSVAESPTVPTSEDPISEGALGRDAAENERQSQLSLLNELPAIVYLRAPDYTIHFANRHFRQRFGDPDHEPCYKLIHNRTAPCLSCGCTTAVAEGQLQESEWVFPDDTTYQLYDYPFVDVDGVEKVFHLGIDISKRKRAEADLEIANRELRVRSQAEHQRRLMAEGLAEAALALNSTLDSSAVLDQILEQTLKVASCTGVAVLLVENEQIRLAGQRGLGWQRADLERFEAGLPLEDLPRLQAACVNREAILIPDAGQDPQGCALSSLEDAASVALLPLVQGNQVTGFVALFGDRPGVVSPASILQLASFASHAALAIENARLYQWMKDSREQLQSLSRRLVEIQENERRLVARELHDEAGQALTSLMIQLKLLQRDAGDADRVRSGISMLMGEVDSVMQNLHRLAMDLRPASLDRLGLVAALRQHCRTLAEQHEIEVAIEVVGIDGRVAPGVETALYRIVQEALNNVVRHSQATRVDVLLERRGDRIVVIVEDNGQGFEPSAASGPDHLGLVGMEERAVALGGSLIIESTPCRGTAIFVEVPDVHPGLDCR